LKHVAPARPKVESWKGKGKSKEKKKKKKGKEKANKHKCIVPKEERGQHWI
jgi:hypothetical protein